jgi:hypothetical protein
MPVTGAVAVSEESKQYEVSSKQIDPGQSAHYLLPSAHFSIRGSGRAGHSGYTSHRDVPL